MCLDLRHLGLILSAGAAVGARFFRHLGLDSAQQNMAAVGFDVARATPASFGALVLQTLLDQLQRDWFNLSPRAAPQVVGLLLAQVGLYAALRRAVAPERAAAAVLLVTPCLPVVGTAAMCAWAAARLARAT